MIEGAVLWTPRTQSDSTKPWKPQSPFRMSCSRWSFSPQYAPLTLLYADMTDAACPRCTVSWKCRV